MQEHPRIGNGGNRYVRRLIWMFSIVAIGTVALYRAYFQRRVQPGKTKIHIIVAVGRKLLSVFYAILDRGVPYDPNWEVDRYFALARG